MCGSRLCRVVAMPAAWSRWRAVRDRCRDEAGWRNFGEGLGGWGSGSPRVSNRRFETMVDLEAISMVWFKTLQWWLKGVMFQCYH